MVADLLPLQLIQTLLFSQLVAEYIHENLSFNVEGSDRLGPSGSTCCSPPPPKLLLYVYYTLLVRLSSNWNFDCVPGTVGTPSLTFHKLLNNLEGRSFVSLPGHALSCRCCLCFPLERLGWGCVCVCLLHCGLFERENCRKQSGMEDANNVVFLNC